MITRCSSSITDLYRSGLQLLKDAPEIDSRVGKTKELFNVCFILDDIRSRKILDPMRRQSEEYIKKELAWYFSKTNRVAFILQASRFWEKVTDDGIHVNSNYGEKAFKPDPVRSQYDRVLVELSEHPNSRRAVIVYMTPYVLRKIASTNDFICNIYSQFCIRDGKLDQVLYTRSCDFIFGWCNDVPFFTVLQEMLATDLGVGLGAFTQVIGSLHIYERHFNLLNFEYTKSYGATEKMFPPMVKRDVEILKSYPKVYDSDINTDFSRVLFGYERQKI